MSLRGQGRLGRESRVAEVILDVNLAGDAFQVQICL